MILLTEEEMKRGGGYNPLKQYYVTPIDIANIQLNIAKAQLKKMVGWLKSKQKSGYCIDQYGDRDFAINWEDWEDLLKECGEDTKSKPTKETN